QVECAAQRDHGRAAHLRPRAGTAAQETTAARVHQLPMDAGAIAVLRGPLPEQRLLPGKGGRDSGVLRPVSRRAPGQESGRAAAAVSGEPDTNLPGAGGPAAAAARPDSWPGA